MPEMNIELKSAMAELKTAINHFAPKETVERLQAQVDEIDVKLAKKHVGDSMAPSVYDQLKSDEGVARLLRDKKGTHVIHFDAKTAASIMERKTTLTETGQGFATSGVLPIDRIPGITPEARQTLKVRDALA
jgi:hypothetical protein